MLTPSHPGGAQDTAPRMFTRLYHAVANSWQMFKRMSASQTAAVLPELGELLHRLENLAAQMMLMLPDYAPQSEETRFLQRFFDALHRELANAAYSVEALADELACSRAQLNRKIKELTELTPVEHLRQIRLERAAQFLRTTSMTVAEIAYDCGFDDPNYFCRVFTKEFQCSPREYRQNIRKGPDPDGAA